MKNELDKIVTENSNTTLTYSETEKKFKMILDAVPLPLFVSDAYGEGIFLNKEAFALLKKEDQQCPHFFQQYVKALDMEAFPFYTNENKLSGNIFIPGDSVKQKKVEKILHSLIVDKTLGIFEVKVDEDLTLLYGNDTFFKLHGTTRMQMKEKYGNKLALSLSTQSAENAKKEIQTAIVENKEIVSFESKVSNRNGKPVWIFVQASFIYTAGMNILCGYVIDLSKHKEAEEQVRINEERYRIALSLINSNVWEYDVREKAITLSDMSLYSNHMDDLVNDMPKALVENGSIHADSALDFIQMHEKIESGEKLASCNVKMRKTDGSYYWTKITYNTIFDSSGLPVRAIGVSEDINAEKSAELRYQQEVQYRNAMVSNALNVYKINLSADKVKEENIGTENESNKFLSSEDDKMDSYSQFISKWAHKIVFIEDRKAFLEAFGLNSLMEAYSKGLREINLDYRNVSSGGTLLWRNTVVHIMKHPESLDILGFVYIKDIDERKRNEILLKEKAERDSLTELYNRDKVWEMIEKNLSEPFCKGNDYVLFMIDIDRFNEINDTFGHIYGDEILRELTARMKKIFRREEIIGRLGGDEFIIYMEGEFTYEIVSRKAQELCQVLRLNYLFAERKYKISASVGIVYSNDRSMTVKQLYEKADSALHQAKKSGKNQYAFYQGTQRYQSQLQKESNDLKKHRRLSEDQGNIVYICDRNSYELYYINAIGRKVFGVDKEYSNNKCFEALYNLDEPCPGCFNSSINEERFTVSERIDEISHRRYIRKDKFINWNGKSARMEIAVDITAANDVHNVLKNRIDFENAFSACINSLKKVGDFEEAISRILIGVGEYYQSDRVYILCMNKPSEKIRGLYEWCRNGVMPRMKNRIELNEKNQQMWKKVFLSKEPILLDSFNDIPSGFENEIIALQSLDISSLYAVPFGGGRFSDYFIGVDNAIEHTGDISLLDAMSYFIISEISKSQMKQNQDFMVYHDLLSGCLNRNSFIEYVSRLVPDSIFSMGVAIADINGLKEINQSYGHRQGDSVVKQTVNILKSHFGEERVFRMGGDEFCVLFENVSKEAFIERIRSAKEEMKSFLYSSATIGYTWTGTDIDVNNLVDHASEMMYIEKQKYYNSSDKNAKHHSPDRLKLLLDALRKKWFHMYLQPKVDVKTGEIKGAEALVRMIHPQYGLIPPDRFIPMLEKDRMIRHIDFFILEELLKTMEGWKKKGIELFPISLNFSRVTMLETDLMNMIESISNQYDVDHKLIEIEITESIGEMEMDTIASISSKIRNQGFGISLDDFGSKYTSMSLLSIMNFTVLKLDKSLVNNLVENNSSQIVVQCVVDMCRKMGVHSVAEGVETMEQLNVLNRMGCDQAQGFLFSKPVPISDFEQLIIKEEQ